MISPQIVPMSGCCFMPSGFFVSVASLVVCAIVWMVFEGFMIQNGRYLYFLYARNYPNEHLGFSAAAKVPIL
jgi:hypothetical protein